MSLVLVVNPVRPPPSVGDICAESHFQRLQHSMSFRLGLRDFLSGYSTPAARDNTTQHTPTKHRYRSARSHRLCDPDHPAARLLSRLPAKRSLQSARSVARDLQHSPAGISRYCYATSSDTAGSAVSITRVGKPYR